MKPKFSLSMATLGLIFLGLSGCAGTTIHKGIELGNPDTTPTKIRITPEGGLTTYDLTFLEKGLASITRTDTRSQLASTALVSLERVGDGIVVQATFPGGEQFEVFLILDPAGKVLSGNLKINGQEIAADFESDSLGVGGGSDEPKTEAAEYDGVPGADQIGPPAEEREAAAEADQPDIDELSL